MNKTDLMDVRFMIRDLWGIVSDLEDHSRKLASKLQDIEAIIDEVLEPEDSLASQVKS